MKTKPTEQDERFGAITMPTQPSTGRIRTQTHGKGGAASGEKNHGSNTNPGQKDYKSAPGSTKSY